jgi:hypothetical protein
MITDSPGAIRAVLFRSRENPQCKAAPVLTAGPDNHTLLTSSLFRLMGRRVAGPTGEPNSARESDRIGANDARHREHLMAPARQLTS